MLEKNEMSIHRALSELKLIDSKFKTAVEQLNVCSLKTLNGKVENRYEVEEYTKNQQSLMQKATDLMDRYIKIKSAIMKSNNVTEVEVNGEKLSITEVLARKESIRLKILLGERLNMRFGTVLRKLDTSNQEIQDEAYKNAVAICGGKNADSKEVEKMAQEYIKNNKFVFVDPLKVEGVIQNFKEEIDVYSNEIDIVLSESNAMTKISI